VVIKSGTTVGELLVRLGATRAFLAFDDRRLRRQLRDDVTRLTNADEANLRRAIDASARQVRAIETLLEGEAWEGLDDEAREVALARLANPEASLAELGEVLDVPRTTVHRRLARLVELAGQDGREGPSASVGS
jgi:DNA-binding protein WhiA